MGKFKRFDTQTEQKKRGDVIRALFSVSYMEEINQCFRIKINNITYSIRVVEEIPCTSECKEICEKVVGEDGGSDWSEERDTQFSFGPADATDYGGEDSSDDGSEGNKPGIVDANVGTVFEEVGGKISNGERVQYCGKVNSHKSVGSCDRERRGFSESRCHGSVSGDGSTRRASKPDLLTNNLNGDINTSGPIISGPKFFNTQLLEGGGPVVEEASPEKLPLDSGEKNDAALSNIDSFSSGQPSKSKSGKGSVSKTSLTEGRAVFVNYSAKEIQRRKRRNQCQNMEKWQRKKRIGGLLYLIWRLAQIERWWRKNQEILREEEIRAFTKTRRERKRLRRGN